MTSDLFKSNSESNNSKEPISPMAYAGMNGEGEMIGTPRLDSQLSSAMRIRPETAVEPKQKALETKIPAHIYVGMAGKNQVIPYGGKGARV